MGSVSQKHQANFLKAKPTFLQVTPGPRIALGCCGAPQLRRPRPIHPLSVLAIPQYLAVDRLRVAVLKLHRALQERQPALFVLGGSTFAVHQE